MDVSSRSNSALNFSPGAHRRSHPNLQHLSLAPLTPRYPVTPSDYSAYFDPETSQLHTSSSLSHIASMPSPGGILSRPGSRANSKTRQGKSKSSVAIRTTSSTPQGALTGEGFGAGMTDFQDHQYLTAGRARSKNDPGWFLQTGMALTEGSRESKGQSWLAKRASSTSLHSPNSEDPPSFEHAQASSARDTLVRSRRSSRVKRRSRRELAMTPAGTSASSAAGEPTSHDSAALPVIWTQASTHEYAVVHPDWADSQTQAEIAADLEMELADELEDGELYSEDGDRYGSLDFGGQGIEDEEKEIQQAVRARGFGLGRWVDGVVDAFLKIDDADDDELEVKQEKPNANAVTTPADEDELRRASEQRNRESVHDPVSDNEMEPAPQNPKTVWEDVAWFGRLVWRTANS